MKAAYKKVGLYFIAILFLVTNGYPFYFLITTSFKSQMDYMMNIWSFPDKLFLENYLRVLEPGFLRYFLNSLMVTAIASYGHHHFSFIGQLCFRQDGV